MSETENLTASNDMENLRQKLELLRQIQALNAEINTPHGTKPAMHVRVPEGSYKDMIMIKRTNVGHRKFKQKTNCCHILTLACIFNLIFSIHENRTYIIWKIDPLIAKSIIWHI